MELIVQCCTSKLEMALPAYEMVSEDVETRISVCSCVCPAGRLHKTGGAVVSLPLHGLLHVIRGTLDSSAGIDGSSVFLSIQRAHQS